MAISPCASSRSVITPAHHAGMFGHDLKHGFEIVGQVGSAVQNLQDLEQQTEFLDLITDLHEPTP